LFFLSIVLFFISSFSFAQPKTILEDYQNFKEGIYKTFEEFKFNSPSVPLTYGKAHKSKSYPENDKYGGSLDIYKLEITREKAKEIGAVWGFCDGRDIYIWTGGDHFNSKYNFIKLDFFGRYCHYREISTQSHGYTSPITGFRQGGGYSVKVSTVAMNLSNGAFFNVTKKNIKVILESDSLLAEKFKSEPNKSDKLVTYLEIYSRKHYKEVTHPINSTNEKDIELSSYLYKSDTLMTDKVYYDRLMDNGNHFLFIGKELRVKEHKNGHVKTIGVLARHNKSENKGYYFKIGTWLTYYANGQLKQRVDYDLQENKIQEINYSEGGEVISVISFD
jgi:hypothetical protein